MRLIQPINFLQMLQPNANPPYDDFVNRIVSYSDQQASVFLQVCQNAVHYLAWTTFNVGMRSKR